MGRAGPNIIAARLPSSYQHDHLSPSLQLIQEDEKFMISKQPSFFEDSRETSSQSSVGATAETLLTD